MRFQILQLLLAVLIAAGICLGCDSESRKEVWTGTGEPPGSVENPRTGNSTAPEAPQTADRNPGSPQQTQETPAADNGTSMQTAPSSNNQTENPQPAGTSETPSEIPEDNPAQNRNPSDQATDNRDNQEPNNNTGSPADAVSSDNRESLADAGAENNEGSAENPADAGDRDSDHIQADAGATADAGNPPVTPPPPTPPPVLETPASGVLVTAPEELMENEATQQTPETHADAPQEAAANPEGLSTVTSTDGFTYSVRAFPKEPNETLEEWNSRSYYGDSSPPMETVLTANYYPASLYVTDDEGVLPVIHALIATERFVYRIDWRDPVIPSGFTAAVEFVRENRNEYFSVPAHLKVFVRGITVR